MITAATKAAAKTPTTMANISTSSLYFKSPMYSSILPTKTYVFKTSKSVKELVYIHIKQNETYNVYYYS